MTQENRKNCINLAVAAVLFTGTALLLPAGNGLTEKGVLAVATFLTVVYLWVANEQVWASILAFSLIALLGITPSSEIITYAFGNNNLIFVAACSLLADALRKTGVMDNVSRWMLSRRICENHPRTFIAIYIGSAMLMTFFISSVPVIIMYLNLAQNICQEIGYRKNSKFGASMVIGLLVVTIVAEVSTPFSHPQVVYLFGLIQMVGLDISVLGYTLWGVLFNLCIYLIILLALQLLIKDEYPEFTVYSARIREQREQMQPLSAEGRITAAIFVLTILTWLGGDLFKPISPQFAAYISGLGLVIPCMTALVLLNAIQTKKGPVYSVKDGLANIPWSAVLFLSSMMAITYILTSETTGVSVWLGNLLLPLAKSVPQEVLLGGAVVIALAVTQFITNFITVSVMWTILLPIMTSINAAGGKCNIVGFGIVLLLAANVAFLFPSSQSMAPLFFSSEFLDDRKLFYKVGGLIFALSVIFCAFVFLPITQALV